MDSPPSECFWIISDLETNHGSQHFAFSPIFVTSNQPFFRGIFHDSEKKHHVSQDNPWFSLKKTGQNQHRIFQGHPGPVPSQASKGVLLQRFHHVPGPC
jgi:hypothetical protein